MENSCYYFFSSVPQVLAGTLALFGALVLFKLQPLSRQLSEAVEILADSLRVPYKELSEDMSKIRLELCKLCYSALYNKSYKSVSDFLKTFDDSALNSFPNYTVQLKKFKETFSPYQDLYESTLRATVFTSVVIIVCIALIPFVKVISFCWLIYVPLFAIILLSIAVIFYLLISIVKKSIK